MDYKELGALGILSVFIITKLIELIKDLSGGKKDNDSLVEHKIKELEEQADSLMTDIGKLRHRLYSTVNTVNSLELKVNMIIDGKIKNGIKESKDY